MKILMFYHSLLSDWNHGNAHFLRGIVTELQKMNHQVQVFEPEEGWSLQNLLEERGEKAIAEFKACYPQLTTNFYSQNSDFEEHLKDADLVIVHEWNDPELVRELGEKKKSHHYKLLFHDTHHRAVTAPEEMEKYELQHYDGVLAFGKILEDLYLKNNWTDRAWTWHEAADINLFKPSSDITKKEGDVVWIGNWGDDERTDELKEFLIQPVLNLGLKLKMYGVRYPKKILKELEEAGIEYGGYLPSCKVPGVFSKYKLTVHVPRRPYTQALPGIPTIRPFEALACGIPLISAPWDDCEHLFREGSDFKMVKDGAEMEKWMERIIAVEDIAEDMKKSGYETIQKYHTCRHRAKELINIYESIYVMNRKNYRIAFFGSSLVSAYWNGAATYYRGIIKALNRLGHQITFFEPDAFDRQKHRDIPDPEWAEIVVYEPNEKSASNMLLKARNYDIVVKANGVGVLDAFLEQEILNNRQPEQLIIFWDVDAPATLHSMKTEPDNKLRSLIPEFDLILTYGGGQPVIDAYETFNAQKCVPIYNALDPDTHHPVSPEEEFTCDLGFLGNRLPDREKRVEDFFLKPAAQLSDKTFILGGSGWDEKSMPGNVKYIGHVYTKNHNAFNSSAKAVLNISRDSMAETGFSPATRVFEAAGSGACIITDAWKGIEQFLEPRKEILVVKSGEEVIEILNDLSDKKAKSIGTAALKKVRAEHTYTIRAKKLVEVLDQAYKNSNTIKHAQQIA